MTQPEPITPPAEPAAPQAAAPAPPWGTDEQFDPAKAWSLIQNLRGDLTQKTARIAELTPYEQKIRDAEDAQKSEVQRLTEQMAEVQKTAAERTTEALRLRIAIKNGISDEDAETFLTGATEEQMTRQAERLVAMQGSAAPPPAARTPVAALRPGALPNPAPLSLPEQIAAAEKAKDWKTSMALKSQLIAGLAEQNK